MPIIKKVRLLFSSILIFLVSGLFAAAPLDGGFTMAPKSSASREEKERAYSQARQKVIEASRKYEGTPYVYGGMTSKGTDCSGFICLSFRDALGVALPRSASGLYSWVERIPFEKAQPGDLLFFRTDHTRSITHVGLYLGNRRFIHVASAGAKTGVIYSSLDEQYWSNAFAGAGRAFPEASSGFKIDDGAAIADSSSVNGEADSGGRGAKSDSGRNPGKAKFFDSSGDNRYLVGIALAPIYNTMGGDAVFRGFTSQLYVGTETSYFGPRLGFGFELRPEFDGVLDVFRLPITLSLGINDKFRIFLGPVFSFGDASISVDGSERQYYGGTSWLGTVGVTLEPFNFKVGKSELAPYLEAAWQSYHTQNTSVNLKADFSANVRLSTGLRWRIPIF